MGFLQVRHFPPSRVQLTTGKLSYQAIQVRHLGQRDRGFTIDMQLRGRRKMQTFRKEPTTSPKRPENTQRIRIWFSAIRTIAAAPAARGLECRSGRGPYSGFIETPSWPSFFRISLMDVTPRFLLFRRSFSVRFSRSPTVTTPIFSYTLRM